VVRGSNNEVRGTDEKLNKSKILYKINNWKVSFEEFYPSRVLFYYM